MQQQHSLSLLLRTNVIKEEPSSFESQSLIEALEFVMYADESVQHSPILFNQDMFNDLVRDLVLPNGKAEVEICSKNARIFLKLVQRLLFCH